MDDMGPLDPILDENFWDQEGFKEDQSDGKLLGLRRIDKEESMCIFRVKDEKEINVHRVEDSSNTYPMGQKLMMRLDDHAFVLRKKSDGKILGQRRE
ncbi:hypothetical protein Tco_0957199 [Tanacetum coccineum]